MRAVNLLPPDLRGAAPAARLSARPEPAEGIGAYVILGALALCVALLAVYVLANNRVNQKQSNLADVTAQADAAGHKAAQLKPYADFDALAKSRVETVRGLAAARFDWQAALSDLSRAMPGDVKLQNLTGDMGTAGASAGGDPLRGSIQAPAVSLAGCASSQPGVARLLARLRAVNGVTRVSLSKSQASDATGPSGASTSPCRGKNPPTFSAVVFFERSAALAALAPAAAQAATASSVPVPNAVNGAANAGSSSASGAGNGQATGGAASTPATPTSGANTP